MGCLTSCAVEPFPPHPHTRRLMELHLETMFKAWTGYFGGSRELSYTCICGSGANGSILHYGHAGRPNDRTLEAGDMVVLDMGAPARGRLRSRGRGREVGAPIRGVFLH